ncbi:MAG: hypothetical protein VYE27_00205 [Pseudomonadota bacterium]|nr:hypothetical protein [Pseudomonadota bacterium]
MYYRFKKTLSRTAKCSAFFLSFGLISAEYLFSQTVHNYGQWQKIGSIYQSAYIAGVIDERLSKTCENCGLAIRAENLRLCLIELNISTPEIVAMVNNFYQNRNNWPYSPQQALDHQLVRGHCFTYVNE